MAISAVIFLILGISFIGFSVLSFQNMGDMPFMDDDAEKSYQSSKNFSRWQIKVALCGAVLLAIGLVLAWLTGG